MTTNKTDKAGDKAIVDHTAAGQTDAITFEFNLRHPPKKVWRAISDPALLAEWLLPVVDQMKLERGASFTLQTQAFPGWDGKVKCKLLEIEPHTKLSYTWVVGDDLALDTVVTFTLTETPTGTHLLLVQSGFKPAQKQNFGGARYGWNMMGEKLVDVLGRTA